MKTTIATLITALCIALASPQVSAEQITCRKDQPCLNYSQTDPHSGRKSDCSLTYRWSTPTVLGMEEHCDFGFSAGSWSDNYALGDVPARIKRDGLDYQVIKVEPGYIILDRISDQPILDPAWKEQKR